MSIKLIKDLSEENILINKLYFSKNYLELFVKKTNENNYFILWKKKSNYIIIPIILREINYLGFQLDKLYYDFESPYGYSGILCSESISSDDVKIFNSSLIKLCEKENIVAGFLRSNIDQIFIDDFGFTFDRDIIILSLDQDYNDIWTNSFHSKLRNVIRKGLKKNLVFEFVQELSSKNIDDFKKIYFETMSRVNAKNYYFFSDLFFKKLLKKNSKNIKLARVKNNSGVLLASAFFLEDKDDVYYFLSGSTILADNSVVPFLLSETIKYYANKKNRLILGGGLSNNENDSLYKFKKKFSKTSTKFYISKKIFNHKIYNLLIRQYDQNSSNNNDNNLLRYRDYEKN